MSDPTKCPQCRTPLPSGVLEGLCPACLLKQGATADSGVAGDRSSFEALPIPEVARLFPQLEILELIGKGGMGAIYKARQPALGRLIALKILPSRPAGGPNFAERFNREARALARLNHPNIVGVHEFGQIDGLHYFLMEYVDGVNLRQLEQNGRLSPRDALQIIPQICDALQYAHDEGVVHRDIKPENVLVDRKGRVKIADFGLAKILDPDPAALRLTGEGQVMGTPHYMAPEQVEHPLQVDHRADIYALGVVFYEMLTGELPLGKFAPPSRKVQLDIRFDDVVLRALEKEPERRYQQASQVKTAVQDVTAASPATAAPASQPQAAGAPPNWRERLQYRIWPPLVGRRQGQRIINWPAVIMRGSRALFSSIWLGAIAGVFFGLWHGGKAGVFAALSLFGVIGVLTSFVLCIRTLRGLAMPLRFLPALDEPVEPLSWFAPRSSGHRKPGPALWSGAAAALCVFVLATLMTMILPRQYFSIARIRLNPDTYDPYVIQTEAAVMRSPAILDQVIQRLNLKQTWTQRYGREFALSRSELLDLLNRHLEIRQGSGTALLEIRCYDEARDEAADIANAVAESYVGTQRRLQASLVEKAEPALRPARPNVPINLLLGALAGMFLGAGVGGAVFWLTPRSTNGSHGQDDREQAPLRFGLRLGVIIAAALFLVLAVLFGLMAKRHAQASVLIAPEAELSQPLLQDRFVPTDQGSNAPPEGAPLNGHQNQR